MPRARLPCLRVFFKMSVISVAHLVPSEPKKWRKKLKRKKVGLFWQFKLFSAQTFFLDLNDNCSEDEYHVKDGHVKRMGPSKD